MIFRAAIALLALATPIFAQHGGHAGSVGSRGGQGAAGHAGFSGFSQSRSFAAPAPPVRYSAPSARVRASASAGFRGTVRPGYPIPSNGNRINAGRPAYRPAGAGRSGASNRGQSDARRRSFNNWYTNYYPAWRGYEYPYLIDPGFYDWGDSDTGNSGTAASSDSGTSAYDQGGGAAAYPAPYPDEGYGPAYVQPAEQSAAPAPAAVSAPLPKQPLTVIFKSGRDPIRIENYMMTATVLTDLDAQHYEQIPLDQVDRVATQWANSAAGVDFQIPGAARN
jgi:hypothetical protein